METNRSWSIDDKRYNFQFGCEIGWEIRNGKRVRMLKNPSYSGISTEFWNACAAIAGPRALDAVGRSELRQRTARAGDGHGPRREPGALPQDQGRERVCRDDDARAMRGDLRAGGGRGARARASTRSKPSSARSTQALTRFANNTIHQNVAERDAHLSVRAGDRRAHGARHHQPAGSRWHPRRGGGGHRDHAAEREPIRTCCRWRSRRSIDGVQRYFESHRAGDAGRARAGRGGGHPRGGGRRADGRRHLFHGRDPVLRCTIRAAWRRVIARPWRASPSPRWPATVPGGPRPAPATVRALDPVALARSAARKAAASRDPRELPPGRYTVILEPAAVLDLVGQMFVDFSATAIRDGRSFLNDRIGQKLFGENITIYDDVRHPLQAGRAVRWRRRAAAAPDAGGGGRGARDRVLPAGGGAGGRGAHRATASRCPTRSGEAPMNIVIAGGDTQRGRDGRRRRSAASW